MQQETAERIRSDMRQGYASAALEASMTHERLYGEELKRFVDYIREKEAILDVGCGDGRAFEVFRGKHVAYAKTTHTKLSNLLLTMLTTVGVKDAQLGDSTGALTDL